MEAKTGYGGSTQLTVKKEWLDKIKEEAERTYGIGILVAKFLGAKTGVKHFVVMDIYDFIDLISSAEDVYQELEDLCSKDGEEK